jgi:hypothetical protein
MVPSHSAIEWLQRCKLSATTEELVLAFAADLVLAFVVRAEEFVKVRLHGRSRLAKDMIATCSKALVSVRG